MDDVVITKEMRNKIISFLCDLPAFYNRQAQDLSFHQTASDIYKNKKLEVEELIRNFVKE